jgi:hypothetical protein
MRQKVASGATRSHRQPTDRFVPPPCSQFDSMPSITLLGMPAVLLLAWLTPTGAEETPARLSQPSLIVTPASSMAPLWASRRSVLTRTFRVSSELVHGTVRYSIRTPSWLTASSTFGTTDTGGLTLTLTVNANASRLSPGAYGPGVAFTNVSNGQGSTIRPAKLVVQGSSPPRASGQIAPNRGGFLLDDHGVLDDRADRLLAQ